MGKIGADGMSWKRSDFYVSFMGVTGSAYHFRQNHHRSSQLLRGTLRQSALQILVFSRRDRRLNQLDTEMRYMHRCRIRAVHF